ncbi:unnamed protein product [Prunus armeniaca]|uniref:Uncharacterized protein n=1 Tax=Prunus armeniaca TaxID=36596 RepID=A0A6J5U2B0_PRUAR|nr:unnamed protein product [Prunus armeniaca]CAB4299095.1 unnamed protein product [Prunus armeniaca]
MAMRQRFGGISSTRPRLSSRSIYEDFKPHFELKEEQEAHVIHVHLPEYTMFMGRYGLGQLGEVVFPPPKPS